MKKTLFSAVLCLLMIAGSLCAAAAPQTNEERLLAIVKDRIASTDQYQEFQSSSDRSEEGARTTFSWSSPGYLSVTITDDGVITSYWGFSEEEEPQGININRPSVEELTEAAYEAVRSLNPDLEFSVFPESAVMTLSANSISFSVYRTVHGIPVLNESGYVELDLSGRLTSFSLSHTQNVSFGSDRPALSVGLAKEQYREQFAPKLFYQPVYAHEEGEENRFSLIYRLTDNNRYISAQSGKAISAYTLIYDRSAPDAKSGSGAEEASANDSFTPLEQKHLDELEGLLSREELEQRLRSIDILALDPAAKSEDYSLYGGDGSYRATLQFSSGTAFASVSMNAADGELLWFSASSSEETEKADEAALTAAFSVLAPQKSKEYRYEDGLFHRYSDDGIPFEGNDTYLFLDNNHKVVDYSLGYSDWPLDSADGVLSPQEAADRLLEQCDYRLYYLISEDRNAELVYALEDRPYGLDPFDGTALRWKNVSDQPINYPDIEGHYVKEAAETLAAYGIGFQGGALEPDREITVGEFQSLLDQVFSTSRGRVFAYDEVRQLRRETDALNEDTAPLRRDLAAKMTVCAMGCAEVAALDGIYRCPFTDVTEEIGSVTILYGMNVLCGNGDGTFTPAHCMTRAEALTMLYRYLLWASGTPRP